MAVFSTTVQQVVAPAPSGDGMKPASVVEKVVEGVAPPKRADLVYTVGAYILVGLGVLAAWGIVAWRNPTLPVAVVGMNAFAALYVAAQAIERVLAPFREWLGDPLKKVQPEQNGQGKHQKTEAGQTPPAAGGGGHQGPLRTWRDKPRHTKSDLRGLRSQAIQEVRSALTAAPGEVEPDVQGAADQAAQAQADVDHERANATVVFWALASFLGIVVSAYMGLGLLHSVGVQQAPRLMDVVVTGLAIGGGTKPLHDLIGSLQASKENKTDPAEVTKS